jgi:hypothetical protein
MPMVGLAALELLTGLTERTPLLVVAEDAHCLDLSMCEVLAFVSRRLGADAVGLLVTARVSELGDNPLAVAGSPARRAWAVRRALAEDSQALQVDAHPVVDRDEGHEHIAADPAADDRARRP